MLWRVCPVNFCTKLHPWKSEGCFGKTLEILSACKLLPKSLYRQSVKTRWSGRDGGLFVSYLRQYLAADHQRTPFWSKPRLVQRRQPTQRGLQLRRTPPTEPTASLKTNCPDHPRRRYQRHRHCCQGTRTATSRLNTHTTNTSLITSAIPWWALGVMVSPRPFVSLLAE